MGLLALHRHCIEERISLLNIGEPGRIEVLCSLSDRVEYHGGAISLAAHCKSQVYCFDRHNLVKQAPKGTSIVLSFRAAAITAVK